jgi:hypothetical protein
MASEQPVRLVACETDFYVPRSAVLKNCELFGQDPALADGPYIVKTDVRIVELFRVFIRFIEDFQPALTPENAPVLIRLSFEFRFWSLAIHATNFWIDQTLPFQRTLVRRPIAETGLATPSPGSAASSSQPVVAPRSVISPQKWGLTDLIAPRRLAGPRRIAEFEFATAVPGVNPAFRLIYGEQSPPTRDTPESVFGLVLRFNKDRDFSDQAQLIQDFFKKRPIKHKDSVLPYSFVSDGLHAFLFYNEKERTQFLDFLTHKLGIQRFACVPVRNTQFSIVAFFDGANSAANLMDAKVDAAGFNRLYDWIEIVKSETPPGEQAGRHLDKAIAVAGFKHDLPIRAYWESITMRLVVTAGIIQAGDEIWHSTDCPYIDLCIQGPRCPIAEPQEIENTRTLMQKYAVRSFGPSTRNSLQPLPTSRHDPIIPSEPLPQESATGYSPEGTTPPAPVERPRTRRRVTVKRFGEPDGPGYE